MGPIKRLKTQHYTVRELGIVLEVRGLKTRSLRCHLARVLFDLGALIAGLPIDIEVSTEEERQAEAERREAFTETVASFREQARDLATGFKAIEARMEDALAVIRAQQSAARLTDGS